MAEDPKAGVIHPLSPEPPHVAAAGVPAGATVLIEHLRRQRIARGSKKRNRRKPDLYRLRSFPKAEIMEEAALAHAAEEAAERPAEEAPERPPAEPAPGSTEARLGPAAMRATRTIAPFFGARPLGAKASLKTRAKRCRDLALRMLERILLGELMVFDTTEQRMLLRAVEVALAYCRPQALAEHVKPAHGPQVVVNVNEQDVKDITALALDRGR
jgi:hypothetical protein